MEPIWVSGAELCCRSGHIFNSQVSVCSKDVSKLLYTYLKAPSCHSRLCYSTREHAWGPRAAASFTSLSIPIKITLSGRGWNGKHRSKNKVEWGGEGIGRVSRNTRVDSDGSSAGGAVNAIMLTVWPMKTQGSYRHYAHDSLMYATGVNL